jgi:outer membrane protein assembly factor BamB
MINRRLRGLLLFVLAYGVSLAVIWGRAVPTRQDQVIATLIATFVALLAAVTWFLVGSGLSRRARVAGVVALIVLVLTVGYLFRLGVTGDIEPVLQYRFAAVPDVPQTSVPAGDRADIMLFVTTPGDSQEFLGPSRNGTFLSRLDPDWTTHPPEELWRRPVGAGWGSFAAVGNVAITQEQRGDMESVIAYTVDTGELLWAHRYPGRYDAVIAGTGPRATPAIWGDTVWSMGATGVLSAVELFTGEPRWSVNVIEDQGGSLPEWGKSSSPLIHADLVIVTGGWGGPNLIAYDRMTGAFRWRADAATPDYASPQFANVAGRDQIVIFNADSVSAHRPTTGETLWSAPWPTGQPTVAQPLVMGNLVLASSGYGRGAKLFGISRRGQRYTVSTLWESPRLKAKFANFVQYEGFVYGLDDGVLTCIDPADGERRWKGGRYGHGQLLVSRGLLVVQAEDGSVVLVEATPETHRELHRVPVLNSKTWNAPVLVGDVLLVRNDREAVGLKLPLRD